jgi:hypothetical protein
MENDQTTGGLIAAGVLLAVIFFTLGAVVTRDKIITEEGITGDDLKWAFIRCEPGLATFEQTLACTQAIYGGYAHD